MGDAEGDRSGRYGAVVAAGYDVASGEWPFYRPGRLAGIRALRAGAEAVVVDLGCGTGLSFGPILRAVGPGGRVVGVDASPAMLARARHRVGRAGVGDRVHLVEADLADAKSGAAGGAGAEAVRAALPSGGADAVIACYALSVLPDPAAGWALAVSLLRPGGRAAVVDLGLPTGTGAVLRAVARLACRAGGSDPAARPWRYLERDGTDVTGRAMLAGHVEVRAGTLPGSPPPPGSGAADEP